ncbi:MAG: hypothetical protein ACP5JO_03515 [Candidatus Ratteibacteria bacterium]
MNRLIKSKLWIYFFPALMDLSVAAVLLFSAIRAVEIGTKPVLLGTLGSVWGITYFFSSLGLSKFINKKNASSFMIASCAGFIFIGVFFYACNSIFPLFVLLFAGGLVSSFFFVGFQLFMGDNTGIAHYRTAALYTLSWSSGMAFGSLVEGFFISAGTFYAQLPVFICSLLIIVGIVVSRNTGNNVHCSMSKLISAQQHSEKFIRSYTRIAWIEIFTVTLVTTGIRYLLPKLTISFFNFSQSMAGTAVFVFFIFQALSGFFSSFYQKLRYNFLSHNLMKCAGIISLTMPLIFANSFGIFLFAGLLGIYSGHAFYAAVFYAINDEKQSGFNIGINEALVGIASVFGPLISGVMLNSGIMQFLIFPCVALVISILIQARILKQINRD